VNLNPELQPTYRANFYCASITASRIHLPRMVKNFSDLQSQTGMWHLDLRLCTSAEESIQTALDQQLAESVCQTLQVYVNIYDTCCHVGMCRYFISVQFRFSFWRKKLGFGSEWIWFGLKKCGWVLIL